jgi:hypothetical protein
MSHVRLVMLEAGAIAGGGFSTLTVVQATSSMPASSVCT